MSTVNVVRLMTAGMLLCVLGIFGCPQAKAAGTCPVDRTLKVGVSTFEPMVVKNPDGSFSGFEIELFESAIKDIGCSFAYEEYSDFPTLLKEVGEGKIDVALGGISITASREMGGIDFTHSFYDSGIAVMARQELSGSTFMETAIRLWNSPLPRHVSWLFLYVILLSHLVWWVDKGHDNINDKYIPGIFEAVFFVCTTITTVGYGDITAKKGTTRVATVGMMFTGIGVAGIIFSDVAAWTMSEADQQYSISSIKNLEGKKVVTVKDTTSAVTLRNRGVSVITVSVINDAYSLFESGKVDGIVFDLPPLKHYSVRSSDKIAILPDLLSKEKYGIALPDDTHLRESLNSRILVFQEDGRYQKIYERYFDGQ